MNSRSTRFGARRLFVPVALVLVACSAPSASKDAPALRTSSAPLTIGGLFPTGVDNERVPLDGLSVDPHYKLVGSADVPGLTPEDPGDAYVMVEGYPIQPGIWVENSTASKWISVQGSNGGNGGAGDFTFRTTANLREVDLSTAVLDLKWAADNSVVLKLNGVAVSAPSPSFTSYLTLNVASGFVAGENTLDFVVNNGGGPLGLRVDEIKLTANCTSDSNCSSSARWCNALLPETQCVDKTANGELIPGGACSAALATRACASGVCFEADNRCGLPNGEVATSESVCRSGMIGSDGKCGLLNGEGAGSAAQCRSGVLGADELCGLPNGVSAASASECRSSVLGADGQCGLPNGESATNVGACRSALLGSNGRCGLVNGQAGCTVATAAVSCQSASCDSDGACGFANGAGACTTANSATICRSGLCSAAGTCVAAGACASDADCAGAWCNLGTATCSPKLPNERPIPTDATHTNPVLNGLCTPAAAALTCASGVCDTSDNTCGFTDGAGSCTSSNASTVCRSGRCKASGVCGSDVSPVDAGASADAGSGTGDAGRVTTDAGIRTDAGNGGGTGDAATPSVDAGAPGNTVDAQTPTEDGGSSCAMTPGGAGSSALFSAALALLAASLKRTRRRAA